MKTVELPESVFEKLETYRRAKKLSLAEAIEALLDEANMEELWWRELSRPNPATAHLSEEEVERIATEMVREERRSRRR